MGAHDLSKLSRAELDEAAVDAGVENPADLPNREAVIEAILDTGNYETTHGPYLLVDEVDGEPVTSLTFGADPVIILTAGEEFLTQEASVAAFLDEHPAVRGGS